MNNIRSIHGVKSTTTVLAARAALMSVQSLYELNKFLETELNLVGIIETDVNAVIGSYKRSPYIGI